MCLESLNNQTKNNFKLILVGLKKDKKVKELIARFTNRKIIYFIQKKKGLIGAANEALEKATNEIFIRIDDDVILDKDWFKNVIKTFEMDEKIGGVTGPTIMSEEGLQSRDITAFLEKFKRSQNPIFRFFYFLYNDWIYEKKMHRVSSFLKSGVFTLGSNYESALKIRRIKDVNNLEACNWSARTELVKKIGGFDEIYSKGLGDYHEADAALKIKKLGYRLVFNSKAKLKHNVEFGKVEKTRPASYHRIQNFIIFYFRFFKIKSVGQLLRFIMNVLLQNCYYFSKFLTTGKINQLGALLGTLIGFIKVTFRYKV